MLVVKLKKGNFQTIQTGLSEDQLSDRHKKMLTTWKNKFGISFGDLSNESKIDALISAIIKRYDKPSSQRIHLETLANVLLSIDKVKNKKIANQLFKRGIDIQNQIALHSDQTATEKEKEQFIYHDDLLNRMNELKLEGDQKEHMKKLILAINTLYPPLRLECLNMQYVTQEPPIDGNNYIYNDGGKFKFVINNDKVSKTMGPGVHSLYNAETKHAKVPYLRGEELNAILDASFKLLPRDYLLCAHGNKGDPMSLGVYNRLLKAAAGVDATQNILRKSYIQWFYNIPKILRKEKDRVADLMRHTQATAEGLYLKLDL